MYYCVFPLAHKVLPGIGVGEMNSLFIGGVDGMWVRRLYFLGVASCRDLSLNQFQLSRRSLFISATAVWFCS